MRDPRITLKDPGIAALLAWLIPGAGHFYQGRRFKGAIYSVCILGLFLSGWAMADWSAVQPPDVRNPGANKTLLLKYTAQLGVGLPSLFGLAQSRRFASEGNVPTTHLDSAVACDFEGTWLPAQYQGFGGDVGDLLGQLRRGHEDLEYARWPLDSGVPAAGRITLEPKTTELGGASIAATFAGTIDGQPTELKLSSTMLEEPIRSHPRRRVFAVGSDPGADQPRGILVASIPRPFLNHIAVPMSPREENLLHAQHGNALEIWMVFTWIAGLLNMLAVWDAFDGPAYAYGDETGPEGDAASPPPTA